MNIIPAIDLYEGQCVRLKQGQFGSVQYYETDPIALAAQYRAQGAQTLHVVDLNGARHGEMVHNDTLAELAAHNQLTLQVGGGVRQASTIQHLLEAGVDRVVLGSLAVSQPQMVRQQIDYYGSDRFVLALDVCYQQGMPKVLAHGWQQQTGMALWQILQTYQAIPGLRIMCTDTERDGMMTGPNWALYQWCMQAFPHLQFQASGGVSTLWDLQTLSQVGVPEVVVGKALYAGSFSLQQAMRQVAFS